MVSCESGVAHGVNPPATHAPRQGELALKPVNLILVQLGFGLADIGKQADDRGERRDDGLHPVRAGDCQGEHADDQWSVDELLRLATA